MMAPPGSPKTSVTPSFSSEARIAPEPVIRFGSRGGAAGAASAVIESPCDGCLEAPKLPGDRTLGGRVHELGVLRENATGIARRQGSPAGTAALQLGRIDK